MLNVNIVTVGKLKESYLREACAEYVKRLGAFCRVEVAEIPERRLSDNPSEKEIAAALGEEAKNMTSLLGVKDSYNIAMCIEGKMLTSPELSAQLAKVAVEGKSTVNFIIGSSCGISEEVKQKAHLKLSMSRMTFPHQLARVMLLEQVYRAFQIANNGKYHK